MGVYQYDKTNNELKIIAGGLLYADSPVGSIIPYGGTTVPDGWMICNGDQVSKTTYSELYAVIGDSFKGAKANPTSGNFYLPDLREVTLKGVGANYAYAIHNHESINNIGGFIEDRIQSHLHSAYTGNKNGWIQYTEATSSGITIRSQDFDYNNAFSVGEVANARNGNTTEVKAVGVNYIIKAKQISVPIDIASGVSDMVSNAISEALAIKTVTPTIDYSGASVTCVRSGQTVMVYVHVDSVNVSFNTRTTLAHGFPIPAGNVTAMGFTDWGGIQTNNNVELTRQGVLQVVGGVNTSLTDVTVDSTFTYVTKD